MDAATRPRVLLIDQNLRSQVNRYENVTTGTQLTTELRAKGYTGIIIIRSANISRSALQDYLTAGANAVMSKDEQRDALLRILAAHSATTGGQSSDAAALETTPLLDTKDSLWVGGSTLLASKRDAMVAVFRVEVRRTLESLGGLLDSGDLNALHSELHQLVGQCGAMSALRLSDHVQRCKANFTLESLKEVELLLEETLRAMDAAAADLAREQGAPSSSQQSVATDPASATHSQPAQSAGGSMGEEAPARQLVGIGVDDSMMCRLIHKTLFEGFMKCDMTRSGSIGATAEEQEAFVEVAMGRLTLKLEAVPPADQQQADFVVLDNDLPQSGLSATVLAARLLQLGFSGLTAVLTGADREQINEGGFDVVLSKGDPLKVASAKIWQALADKRQKSE